MRGALHRRAGGDHPGGIIPADAGSTLCLAAEQCQGWGSSPRMRGAPSRTHGTQTIKRIIPADAGSTHPRPPTGLCSWDHPRGCGEHPLVSQGIVNITGSSPRMRGAPSGIPGNRKYHRIIPADAGSTKGWLPFRGCERDHPRGCGEHYPLLGVAASVDGSSPRMRGAPVSAADLAALAGIIPADAGSTRSTKCSSTDSADHPRGCGEHATGNPVQLELEGSSPRMRGAPTCKSLLSYRMRIIPADAGSTYRHDPQRHRWKDHPRGCGEH